MLIFLHVFHTCSAHLYLPGEQWQQTMVDSWSMAALLEHPVDLAYSSRPEANPSQNFVNRAYLVPVLLSSCWKASKNTKQTNWLEE